MGPAHMELDPHPIYFKDLLEVNHLLLHRFFARQC